MTKRMAEKDILKYVAMMEMEFCKGRADGAAQLHEVRPGTVAGDRWDSVGAKAGGKDVMVPGGVPYLHPSR